jgi:hypothetical protein
VLAIGYLDACGLNLPHTHPRATEINLPINGTLRTGFLAENNARFVFNDVPAGSATVFPKGAIHFEMNMDCREFRPFHIDLAMLIFSSLFFFDRPRRLCCRF